MRPLYARTVLLALLLTTRSLMATETPFAIRVVDEKTGRGVPLVELETVHQQVFVTDSAGRVAVTAPELQHQRVYFHVRSHGYEYPADGFGYRGVRLDVRPGEEATVTIPRRNIAERLYRVTGAGLYADTVAVGEAAPIRKPLLNAQVMGADSVVTAEYRDQLYWFWGDTHRIGYPLGNFHVSGATSSLPAAGGWDPARGVDLEYFVDSQGFAKQMARMPGEGPTWIWGLVVVEDDQGERLFTGFEKVQGLQVYQRGIAEFDNQREEFVLKKLVDKHVPLYLHGHPFRHQVDGVTYFYFGDPYPVMRVPATAEAVLDLARYEGFTCLVPGSRKQESPRVERCEEGRVVWGWKRDTAAICWSLQQQLLKQGQLAADEVWLQLVDAELGDTVVAHRGSVTWNDYRDCWVLITTQQGGSSFLGEVWYAESVAPEGPWCEATKVVTHEDYSFYNPKQHPYFAAEGGRFLFFEGTYTRTFSGNPQATPRYDYNQVMYRLDLADPRLSGGQREPVSAN